MLFQETEIREREDHFYKNIIRLYLKYGSVDKVFEATNYELPISYPGMHHLIKRWGIVKSVGPNSKLSEALTFLTLMTDNKIPMERVYRSLPPSFQTSMTTMHRILHNVKMGVTRRHGTALLITPENEDTILTGQDLANKALTLPMTYSSPKEVTRTSILRVLQQEVYSELAVNKSLPKNIIPNDPKPFMFLTIADIKVAAYHIEIPKSVLEANNFSSFKVSNHKFENSGMIIQKKSGIRPGVKEIIRGYEKYIKESIYSNEVSEVNLALAEV